MKQNQERSLHLGNIWLHLPADKQAQVQGFPKPGIPCVPIQTATVAFGSVIVMIISDGDILSWPLPLPHPLPLHLSRTQMSQRLKEGDPASPQ